jgi:hypothetical protein
VIRGPEMSIHTASDSNRKARGMPWGQESRGRVRPQSPRENAAGIGRSEEEGIDAPDQIPRDDNFTVSDLFRALHSPPSDQRFQSG